MFILCSAVWSQSCPVQHQVGWLEQYKGYVKAELLGGMFSMTQAGRQAALEHRDA